MEITSLNELIENFKAQVIEAVTDTVFKDYEITAPKYVNLNDYSLYQRYDFLSKKYNISKQTVRNRVHEIMQNVGTGKRYTDAAVIEDGGMVFINELVWLDWIKYRKQLLSDNPNVKKHVEKFNPQKWISYLGGMA